MLTNLLSAVFSEGAAQVIVSAVVVGAISTVAYIGANLAGVINGDAMGGLVLVGASALVKAAQKWLSTKTAK